MTARGASDEVGGDWDFGSVWEVIEESNASKTGTAAIAVALFLELAMGEKTSFIAT